MRHSNAFRRLIRWLILVTGAVCPMGAQEVAAAVGRLHSVDQGSITYSWQAQYIQHFTPEWGGSFTWLNEGHLLDHHRDGAVIQAWRFHRMENNDLRLGLGYGPYRYFDTTTVPSNVSGQLPGYRNRHGIKSLLSLRAQYPIGSGAWDTFVQLNRTLGPDQTQAFMVGFSTRFGTGATRSDRSSSAWGREGEPITETNNELSLLFGSTILNSFESEQSGLFDAFALQYRRRLTRNLDASIEYSDEGSIDHAKRDGAAIQAWISARSPEHGWLLSFGAGPYFNRVFPDQDSLASSSTVNIRTSLRYSMVVGRHLWGHWSGRLQWNRTLTRYDRDTDMLLAGLAYPW